MAQSGQPTGVSKTATGMTAAAKGTPVESPPSARVTEVVFRSSMPASAEEVFAWHERPGALERLIPAWMPVEVVSSQGHIRDGARVTLKVPVGPLDVRWEIEHVGYRTGREFRDVQRSGPFAQWEHVHRMEPAGPGTSMLEDRISYRLPLPPFGPALGGAFARARIERLLRWRHAITRADLERHAAFAARGPHRIAVTGASGFVGHALVPFLRGGGHDVRTVGRGPSSDIRWDPERLAIDEESLEGVDAVIHLAGAPIATRWTSESKRAILESRVKGTRLIAEVCAAMDPRPDVLVCASAVGYYGDRGDELLDERSAPGDDFLADVVRAWEEAAAPARDAGIRVVHLRFGVVLNPGGGALGKMIKPFLAGFGGRLGSGRQWMSWISREDLIGAIHFALQSPQVHGALNATAPEPVTNATFASTLGRILHRPAIAPVPAFVLRAVYPEMAEATILAGQRVRQGALADAGFPFLHPTLASALRLELGLL